MTRRKALGVLLATLMIRLLVLTGIVICGIGCALIYSELPLSVQITVGGIAAALAGYKCLPSEKTRTKSLNRIKFGGWKRRGNK